MTKKYYIYVLLIPIFCFIFLLSLFFNKVEAASCKEPRPGSAPFLLSATPDSTSVTLVWSEAQDPVTYYLVRYGPSKDSFLYGSPNIGGRGTTSFTVGGLTNGTKYFFQVQAVNGCKPGKFSNTMSATPGSSGSGGGGGGDEISSQERLVLKVPKSLSIYKEVLGTSAATVKEKPTPTKPAPKIASDTQKENCAFNCYSWPLFIAEVALLLAFFHFARRHSSIKPMLSVLIPIAIYIAFYQINGGCTSYKFLCRYFVPLIIIIYISIFISHKYFFLQSATKSKTTRS